jgi:stage V sporulation protein S
VSTTPLDQDIVAIPGEDFLRVGAGSSPQALASAIAHAIYDAHHVDVRAIGAGAVNQAVKAIAIARGYTAPRGFNLACSPGFKTVRSKDGEITSIVFNVFVLNA